MHGLPCSSLQYCFGAPADVSPEPAPHFDSEPCRTRPNASTSPVILTQPQAANLTEPQHQPAVNSISQHTKNNGTGSKEPEQVQQDILHSSPSSESFSEEDMPQKESPVQNTKYPHIPRPSIIRSSQVRLIQHINRAQCTCGVGQLSIVLCTSVVLYCVTYDARIVFLPAILVTSVK
ncbi:hypothetical protein HF521_003678 [Silurus meridionalis]|uniref:Uncharacterized protein n=1 Tax=Silurus meridionalis TaxID=175797 RepID=A0A8T0B279_SILME|nr:hypothetical protein HF521_003678 [Silurus meridionalis]